MKRKKNRVVVLVAIIVLLAIVGIIFMSNQGILFSPSAEISLSVSPSEVYRGQDIILDVSIKNVDNLFAFQTDVNYDSELLEVLSVEVGDFFGEGNEVDNWLFVGGAREDGKIKAVSGARIALAGNYISGEGSLFKVNFVALADGVSNVSVSEFSAVDGGEIDIPVGVASQEIEILQGDSSAKMSLKPFTIYILAGLIVLIIVIILLIKKFKK